MKATEIMIGDWVYSKYSSPEKWQPRQWRTCAYENDFIELANPETSCKPIPLTPEILEKNGWVFMKGQDYSTFPVPSKWTYQFVPFVLRVNGETYSIANTFTIKYVHELQHALLLCGLNDLAENFKV